MHFISNAIEDISGYEASDFYKNRVRSLDSIIHPDDKKTVRKAVEEGIKKGEPYIIEYRIIHKSGKAHWVYERGQGFTADNDEIIYFDGAIFDITDRKEVEEELRRYHKHLEVLVKDRTSELEFARDRAEDTDRLKSAFLATMSHELRTPLNSIIGFTGIVLQGLAGPLNDEQHKQLGMVQSSARHLLNLINDVLDISKIESGQLKVFAESFDMNESINKIVKSVTPLSEGKGLKLISEVAPEIGQITSDRKRVEQILINLVNNAIKFTDKGEVRIQCRINGSRLLTSVKDTGIGIESEDMDNLFKPFRQIDSGIAREYEGTGLGLSICKKLIDLLGGEINVESEWGLGSTFTFTLPMDYRNSTVPQ
jgi:PAS domain S-box-containing protein